MLKYEVMVGVVNILPFFFSLGDTVVMGFQCQHVRLFLERLVPENIHTPKSPTPFPRMFFLVWTLPPPLNFQLCFILTLKNAISFLRSLCPLEFQITIIGVGMDVFWNHTKINSQIHNHNSQWMTSFMIKTCNLI